MIRLNIGLAVILGAMSLTVAHGETACVLVRGPRIQASDLATAVDAFKTLPPDKDFGSAPSGSMVRVFHKAQLAALLDGVAEGLPERLCVERKREAIPIDVWQGAVETAMKRTCGDAPWKAKVVEAPLHRFPEGEIVFVRSGFAVSRGQVPLWRGALTLPDKSSIPVWVRVEIQSLRTGIVLQRPVAAGAELTLADYREEEIWAPGLCAVEKQAAPPVGMIAKRAMTAGTALTAVDLRRPPAVYRGQPVELETASGPARLRVPAIAEHDAEVGEKIHAKSSWNGSRLVGRVTGPQRARVE